MSWTWVATESITLTGDSSVVYTLTIPSSLGLVQRALCQSLGNTANVWYYSLDGSAPSSVAGHRIATSSAPTWENHNFESFGSQLEKLKIAASTAALKFVVDYYT